MIRVCKYPPCAVEFETAGRKLYCSKPHCDRDRNGHYQQPQPVSWESIEDLRHFSKLSVEGKRKVLSGQTRFSVVMFDIEATHLKANIGRIICCSFFPLLGVPYTRTAIDRPYKRRDVYDDGALAAAIRDELEQYDIIVSWNGKMFDTRFINARCIRVGERIKKAQYHIDGMWAWATKMAAWKGLKNVQQFLGTETEKTPIEWQQWMRVLGWDKPLRDAAMAEIVEHCERDVEALAEVYLSMVNAQAVRSLRMDGGIL